MAGSSGETLRKKLDRFWAALFLTEEGKPKSAVFLYSFCVSLLFAIIYGIAYNFLIDWIETLFADSSSVFMRNLLQSVVPGLAGSVVCCSTWFGFRDRRLVPAAYLWLTFFALAALIGMAFICEQGEYRIFLYFFAMLVPVGLISGAAFSFAMYHRYQKRREVKAE